MRAQPALLADQRDEANVGDILAEIFIFRNPDDPDQFLGALIGADRDHQPPADLQLLLERLRNLRSAGGDDDGIVGRMLRPALGAIAVQDVDIVVAEFGQRRRGLFRELAETFDRVDVGRDLRQHRGGIAGTRADLENLLAALQHQGFRHEGDDIGLRNGLLAGNRQRRILIGEFAKVLRQEQLARHLAHGVEDEFVANTARGDIALDHFRAERGIRLRFAGLVFLDAGDAMTTASYISTIPVDQPTSLAVRRLIGINRSRRPREKPQPYSAAFCLQAATGRSGANSSAVSVSLAIRSATPASRSARRRSRMARAQASPASIRSRTARSISRAVASAALTTVSCTAGRKACGRGAYVRWPTLASMPYFVTISTAISVARCRSSAAPVETSPSKIICSEARPPIKHRNPVLQFAGREQKAVLGRTLHGVAERADAAGNDRYFLHGIDARQARCNQRMAHLVISDPPPLFLAEHPALLLDAGHDPLDRDREIVERHLVGLAPGRGDRGLVDQIGDIGAGEAGGEARDLVEIDIAADPDLADVHLEDGDTAALVGTIHQHLAVEPPCPQQRGIEDFGPVGGREQNDAGRGIEAVKFGEQLVERLLLLVVAAECAGRAAAPERIELVDEDDAGRGLARLLEEIAHARGADADEHLDEFGAGDGKERDAGFAGHRAGEQGLAGAGRPDQQDPLGHMRAEPAVALGILEKGHHFLQLEFCLIDAGHVGEGDLGVLLDIDLGPRLADRHQPAKALAIRQLAPEEYPDQVEHQRRHDPRQDGLEQPARRNAGDRYALRLQLFGQLPDRRGR